MKLIQKYKNKNYNFIIKNYNFKLEFQQQFVITNAFLKKFF